MAPAGKALILKRLKGGYPRPRALRPFLHLIARDLLVLAKTPWIVFSRGLFFIIQIFVFAVLMSRVIDVPNFDFFAYYAIGTVLVSIASVAFFIGYDVYEEVETGLLDYLLTLPFSRRVYVLGRAIGGALRSLIYVTPLYALVAFLRGFTDPLALVSSYALLFLLAMGITGLSISVALAIRSEDRFDITLALLELLFVRFSTALYPKAFMPLVAAMLAPFSPVTMTSDTIRALLNDAPLDIANVAGLLGFVAIFFALSASFYFKRIEGGYFS